MKCSSECGSIWQCPLSVKIAAQARSTHSATHDLLASSMSAFGICCAGFLPCSAAEDCLVEIRHKPGCLRFMHDGHAVDSTSEHHVYIYICVCINLCIYIYIYIYI